MMSPWLASGAITTSSLIGSSRIGDALAIASLKPSEPAILKLISDESTEWYLPSKSGDAHVDDREPVDAALLHRLVHALLDRRDELPRDRAADDLVLELEADASLQRLDAHERDAELAVTTGLLLVPTFGLGVGGDRLAVRDLHVFGLDLDAELALEPLERDPEVRLAHAPQQRLVGLAVALEPQRGVFVEQPVQRVRELVLVALRLGADRGGEHRLRSFERRHVEVGAARAEDVTGGGVVELGDRGDVAGRHLGRRAPAPCRASP